MTIPEPSNSYYKAIFDNSLCAVFIALPDGNILDANTEATETFGFSQADLKEMTLFALFTDNKKLIDFLKGDKTASTIKGEVTGVRKNGSHFPCEMSAVIFQEETGQKRICLNLMDISAKRAAEGELFTQQELLNGVINNSNDGIAVVDKNGHFLVFNQVMAELLGCGPLDSFQYEWGKSFNIYYKDESGVVPVSGLPIVRALNGEVIKDEIYLIRNPNKGKVYLSISASPIKDQHGTIIGGLVVDRDITGQLLYEENLKRANEELRNTMNSLLSSNERFNYVAMASNDAIWDLDLQTHNIQRGEGYERLFGYKKNENFDDWKIKIVPDDFERVIDSINKKISEKDSKIWEQEYRYYRSDGSIAYVYDRGYIIYNDLGKAVRMVGALQDITERKKNENIHTQLIDDLLKQNKNLEQFTYIISHNLRAPVANIMGVAEILKDDSLTNSDKNRFVDGLSTSINKLDTVIKDLHTLLQLKQDISEKKENVNLNEIFVDVKNSLIYQISDANAAININFEVAEFLSIKSFIYSIFLNLISNSIKYSKENTLPVIDILSTRKDDNLLLVFRDNGLGINLAGQGKDIFGLYKRFHTHIEGKGLGLFMVKTQIETMNGQIAVKSVPGEGTEFTIELPLG